MGVNYVMCANLGKKLWLPTVINYEMKTTHVHLTIFILYNFILQFILYNFRDSTFYGHAKSEVKHFSEFFPLWSALDSELGVGGGGRARVWDPTFYGHAKSEVKNFFGIFSLCEALWTLNFSGGRGDGVTDPTFFGQPNVPADTMVTR